MAQAVTMSSTRMPCAPRAGLAPASRSDATSSASPRVALSQSHLSSRLLSGSRIPDRVVLRSKISRRQSHAGQFHRSRSLVVAAARASVAVEEADVVIVGAGVSGLCAGLALTTDHVDTVSSVIVTEARDRVGGNITTVVGEAGTANEGYLWEEGPNSFQPNDAMLKCALDSGVIDQLVLGDPDAPRFVFWEGRLRPVPAGLLDLPIFDLMSIIGKIRAGLGAFGLRPAAPEGKEESVEEFVRRNLGAEVFERLIEPFCSGVYAGDPSKLSMKAAFGKVWRLEQLGGSIFGGSLKLIQEKKDNPPPPRDPRLPKPKGQTVGSFQRGLITLPTGIANKLGDRVRLGWKLTGIEKQSSGGFLLSYDTPKGAAQVAARSLLLTVPSYIAADLLKPYSPPAAEALSSFYYPPVAAVTISYPLEAIREERLVGGELKGFGQLHPRTQGIVTLGTIYSSVLFPNRAPNGRVLLLCYIGGACNTKIATMSEEDIVKQVDIDVRKMLIKPNGAAPQTHGVRVWPRAIPQFNVGHLDKLAEAKEGIKEAGLEGVFLGGNYVAGVALGRCVEGGYESAAEIVQYLKQNVAVSK